MAKEIVAHAHRVEKLPPSRAPLLFGGGFVLLVVGGLLGGTIAFAMLSLVGAIAMLAGCDVVVTDCYGDMVAHLRAHTAEERRALHRVAEELAQRARQTAAS